MKKQILSEEFKRMQKLAGIITEGADLYPIIAKPEEKSLYDKIANELKKTISTISSKLDISESNIRIILDYLWKEENKDKGMVVQIKTDDTQWKKSSTGNFIILQTQNGEGVIIQNLSSSSDDAIKIKGYKNPELRAIYNKASDLDLENLVASENTKIANSLSPEELKMIAPNTPIIVTG